MPWPYTLRIMCNGFATDADHETTSGTLYDANHQTGVTSPAAAELVGATSWTDVSDWQEIFDPTDLPPESYWHVYAEVAGRNTGMVVFIRLHDVDNDAQVARNYYQFPAGLPDQGWYVADQNWQTGSLDTPASKTRLRWQYQNKRWDTDLGAYVASDVSAYLHGVWATVSWEG